MNQFIMTLTVALWCSVGVSGAAAGDWPSFRGTRVPELPAKLPKEKWEPLWKAKAAGQCHAGMAVAEGVVVVPDHGDDKDYYRAYDAVTGKQLWSRDFGNERRMDYGPGPRATPLIYKGKTYVVSAFGEVYCFDLKTGKTVWTKTYAKDFGGDDPGMWGFATSPLQVGGKVILFPMNIVALDPDTGNVAWTGEAGGPSYATPIVGTYGGVEQIVGLDSGSLRGWDAKTGRKLWSVNVSSGKGYIVPSPIAVGGNIFISHEGEGAKLFGFGDDGKIKEEPLGSNEDLAPDTLSPAAIGDFILGPSAGLICLDAQDGLKQLWLDDKDDALAGVQHIIPGKDHVLVFSDAGDVALIKVWRDGAKILGKHKLYGGSFSAPAIADGRLYVRDSDFIYCYDFTGKSGSQPEAKKEAEATK